MSDGDGRGGLAERVERLEARVEELETALERRERTVALLAASSEVEGLNATCPECERTELRRESGFTWARVFCDECGEVWDV